LHSQPPSLTIPFGISENSRTAVDRAVGLKLAFSRVCFCRLTMYFRAALLPTQFSEGKSHPDPGSQLMSWLVLHS
jgi:hypothetical protein